MSVEPGFGGQAFKSEVLEKASQLKPHLKPGTLLSIDGGIAADTISVAAAAGCQVFVAGSAIFDEADYTSAVRNLEQLAERATAS
jgi:ribulose-phosphate 3-epimerase